MLLFNVVKKKIASILGKKGKEAATFFQVRYTCRCPAPALPFPDKSLPQLPPLSSLGTSQCDAVSPAKWPGAVKTARLSLEEAAVSPLGGLLSLGLDKGVQHSVLMRTEQEGIG